jgi:hypothetical protein
MELLPFLVQIESRFRMRKFKQDVVTRLLAGWLCIGAALPSAAVGAAAEPARREGAGRRQSPPRTLANVETAAGWRAKRGLFYQRNWGIDIVGVRPVSSGSMLRFDYRVVDPQKASALGDRKARPYLIDERTRTALAVPAMENIGELRQVAPLELNRTYFMIFGNPGGLVKRGSRVTVMVGNLKIEGLVVG